MLKQGKENYRIFDFDDDVTIAIPMRYNIHSIFKNCCVIVGYIFDTDGCLYMWKYSYEFFVYDCVLVGSSLNLLN